MNHIEKNHFFSEVTAKKTVFSHETRNIKMIISWNTGNATSLFWPRTDR